MNNITVKITQAPTIRVKVSGVTYQAVSNELLALQTGKADKTAVASSLALKADITAVNAADALKADKITSYLRTEIDAKDALKANAADVYAKTLTYTKTEIDGKDALKADTTALTAGLALKANQSTTYTKTESDTAAALKAEKLRATNLVTNGDFSQGVTGWSVSGTRGVIESGKLKISTVADTTFYYRNIESIPNGNKVYLKCQWQSNVLGSVFYRSDLGMTYQNRVFMPDPTPFGNTVFSSGVFTNIGTGFRIVVGVTNAGTLTAYYDDFLAIDLTAVFGAGNEPTAQEMDRLLSKYPNSWFDGTAELVTVKDVYTEKADTIKAKNIIENGDFSAGITAWNTPIYFTGTKTLANGALTVTGTGTGLTLGASIPLKMNAGKHYFRVLAKVNTIDSTLIEFRVYGSPITPIATKVPAANTWHELTGVITENATITPVLEVFARYPTVEITSGKTLEFKNILSINLTEVFGAGNEPSKEQMDNLLLKYPNSWFNGVTDLVTVSDLANVKASKIQEPWITPTLVNGWIVDKAIGYMKDQFGFVHLKGRVKSGTVGVTVLQLPVGYRPDQTRYFIAFNNLVAGAIYLDDSGQLVLVGGNNASLSLDSVYYKAEK